MNTVTIRKALILIMAIAMVGLQLYGQTSPKREMRGIWISTVSNIDWPSKPGLTANQLKKETTAILDHLHKMGFNAVFFKQLNHQVFSIRYQSTNIPA